MFQLDFYEQNNCFNKLLCTSTLLEGVNTTAKNIIITKPSRKSNRAEDTFSAFDFFNLVGRTGRLYQHFIGDAYYIRAPGDPVFKKEDAVKSIKFEISGNSKDVDIQMGLLGNYADVVSFFSELGITHSEYMEKIGTKLRFDSVAEMYERYKSLKLDLLGVLQMIAISAKPSRYQLVSVLYRICLGEDRRVNINLITKLLNKQRPRIKKVVDDTRKFFASMDINYLIATAIKMKNGFIEHTFYNRASIIRFFMEKDGIQNTFLEIVDDRILNTIEFLYFSSAKHKKMLLDLGVYERDIEKILRIIGDDFDDAFELKQRLFDNFSRLGRISFISRYVIQNIL